MIQILKSTGDSLSEGSIQIIDANGKIKSGATNGTDGVDGKSAYQLWLDDGNVGTIDDFLASLIGPAGADGAGGVYVHSQLLPSAFWTINHNLNFYPSVTVVDSSGAVVIGDVVYVDLNTVTIEFVGGFSGEAYFS